jgi:[ribosomal protein S18]-alanine N-acetyltransferase
MGSDPTGHGSLNDSPWSIGSGRALGELDGFRLRDARGEDLDALMRIEIRAHQAPWTSEVFRRELELDWSHVWLLVDDGREGQAAGLLVFWVIGDEVHILDVAVDPDYRRRGLAKAMLEVLLSIAAAEPVALMTLEVRVGNTPAQRLYQTLGFEILGRRPKYYQDNDEDAFVMSRTIEE